ncbi:hypothetical protein RF11_04878 [Thelohanellus kitauei]|uniref:Uncharacterized protein n=1 Tax=Thelohanellus kitauei TaxID=669202 RepID=A0A0C2JV42_THEKT|nr:hypothetical protein RF11_04878 [Thelohanellus kitauei]
MLALFWYRNNIQSSTLRSPAELIFGRKLRCTIDNLKPSVAANKDTATLKQKHYHDQGTQDRSFKVGDMVWIKNELKQGYRQGAISKTNGGPIIPGGVRRVNEGLRAYDLLKLQVFFLLTDPYSEFLAEKSYKFDRADLEKRSEVTSQSKVMLLNN